MQVQLWPVDTWMGKPLDCPSDFRFKQLLCEKLLELGASYALPKVEGESLNVGQFKCSSLLMQAALASLGVTHLHIGHFEATTPYYPEILSSEADQLTALDLAVTDRYPGVPLAGIYIGESRGISRAELGWDTPDLKLRVHPLMPQLQASCYPWGFEPLKSKQSEAQCQTLSGAAQRVSC